MKYFLKTTPIEEENEISDNKTSNTKVNMAMPIPRSFNDISPLVPHQERYTNMSIPLSNSDSPSSKSARRKGSNVHQMRYRSSSSKLGAAFSTSRLVENRKEKPSALTPPIDFDRKSSKNLLKIMALCHNIRSKRRGGIPTNKNIFHEKSYIDDDLILNLPLHAGTHFEGSVIVNNELCFKIKVDGKSERYKILGINDSIRDQKRISVILNPEKGDTSG